MSDDNEISSEATSHEATPETTTTNTETTETEKGTVTEALMREEMAKVFDDAQAKSPESRHVMPPVPSANLNEAFENTLDWMNKSEGERATMTDAHGQVARLKANAAQMGVELDDTEALKMAFQIEQGGRAAIPAELTPAMESVKSLYGDQVPFHEAAQRYAQIDSLVRSNPAQGLSEIIKSTGGDEREILREMAAKHSPQEWQQHFAQRDAEVYVEAFLAAYPDADQPAMIEAFGKLKQGGTYGERLHAAYRLTKQQPRKPKQKSMEARMRETYEARQR
jgi:hypothetical protein